MWQEYGDIVQIDGFDVDYGVSVKTCLMILKVTLLRFGGQHISYI